MFHTFWDFYGMEVGTVTKCKSRTKDGSHDSLSSRYVLEVVRDVRKTQTKTRLEYSIGMMEGWTSNRSGAIGSIEHHFAPERNP